MLLERRTVLMGPKGAGKSGTAASQSRLVPLAWPAQKPEKMLDLDDTIVIDLENSMQSIASLGLRCNYVQNLSRLAAKTTLKTDSKASLNPLLDAIDEAFEKANERIAGDTRMTLIFDSVSVLNTIVQDYAKAKHPPAPGDFKWLNIIQQAHEGVQGQLRNLACGYVVCAHSFAPAPIDNADTKKYKEAKAAAQGIGGKQSLVKLHVTGQSELGYLTPATMVCPVTSDEKDNRWIWPKGNKNIPGSNRYVQMVEEKEPANLNALYTKIENKIGELG